jgi:Trk K+ transport system NAD-binding subunit
LQEHHIVRDIQTIIVFVFVMTSIASTYMIKYNQHIQRILSKVLGYIGFRDLCSETQGSEAGSKDIAILGFFRVASSLIQEIEDGEGDIKHRIVVVDFSPTVLRRLPRHGVKVVYGDISNPEILHHAGIEDAKVVFSTISDEILVGTDNLKLIDLIKRIAPQARIVVTAESPSRALTLYKAGADYVLLPNQLAAQHLLTLMERLLYGDEIALKDKEMDRLASRDEVIA